MKAKNTRYRDLINPHPMNEDRVEEAVRFFKAVIDEDDLDNHQSVKDVHDRLSEDEKIEVRYRMGEYVEGTRKKYKTLLYDYLSY